NFYEVFVMYFEIADDNGWDTSPFAGSLPNPHFEVAVEAIGTIWGINNPGRRTVMPKPLFDCLECRLPGEHGLISTLRQFIKVGMLTFDRSQPGSLYAPPRKFNSIAEMFQSVLSIHKEPRDPKQK